MYSLLLRWHHAAKRLRTRSNFFFVHFVFQIARGRLDAPAVAFDLAAAAGTGHRGYADL